MTQISIGGQEGWEHGNDQGIGYFHTYDRLSLRGSAPHKIHIWLPDDYGTSGAKRYQVLYMLDGETAFFKGGLLNKSLETSSALASLAGSISPPIIVAIYPTHRNWQYTHQSNYRDDKFEGGGVYEYADYLANSLKPWVDGNYKTKSGSSDTTILGASFGGLASFIIAACFPSSFGNSICFSGSFYVGDGEHGLEHSSLLRHFDSTLRNKENRPVYWIDWGRVADPENSDCRDMVHQLVTRYGYEIGKDLHIWEDPVGGHNEDSWAFRMKLILHHFYRNR
eukprot:TRINITY_DN5376_c0_g1_i1.p1 TRINITY_DN5376_c0_g1~~TRINITY_DN5376_c0_g1_i1.p1  ORF type:complete len:280 (-),score=44.36 TRINITY_DN5376_c0_g1_i1:17-856(-)